MSVEAVRTLVHEYAWRLDRGDLDGVADLFAAAEWHSPGGRIRCGRDEIREIYDPVILHEDGTPRTQHVITNVLVEIGADGVSATARSDFAVFQAVDGFPLRAVLAGRYHDRFARDDGGWHFVERDVHPDYVGDLRLHMRTPRPGSR